MNDRAIRKFARTLEKKIQKEIRGISVPVTADNPVTRGGELDTNTPLGLLGAQLLDCFMRVAIAPFCQVCDNSSMKVRRNSGLNPTVKSENCNS